MCFDYDDEADIYNETHVKTRKPHRCEGCGKVFPAATQMLHGTGLFDGGWFSFYVCQPCQMLRLSIAAEEIRHGCPWHTAWCAYEDLRDYMADRSEPVEMLTGTPQEAMEYVNRLQVEIIESKRKALWGKREVML